VVGGVLISQVSWRVIFLVSVPIGVSIVVLGFIRRRGSEPDQVAPQRSFDWKGAAMWGVLITSLVLYAHFLPRLDLIWKIGGSAWLAAAGALFYGAEKTRKSNILPLHLFAKNYYHIGLITASLSFASLFAVLVLMPFYLTHVRGLGGDMVGMMMMAVPLTLFIVSPTAGMLYDRLGSRLLTTLGLSICTLSLLGLAMIDGDTRLAVIFFILALLGMGQSMFLAPNTASLLSRIPEGDAGVTSGLLATSRNLGMLIGAAAASMIFSAWYGYFSSGDELGTYRALMEPVFVSSLRATMLCLAALAGVNVCISWRRER
jgi:predicted MFS family arabinose efflux permease